MDLRVREFAAPLLTASSPRKADPRRNAQVATA